MQCDWRNYLVPVEARISEKGDIPTSGVPLEQIFSALIESRTQLNVIILDACRDNPFSDVSSGSGLAQVDAPEDSLLAYFTAPGHVAFDGDDGHGLYTRSLVAHIRTPGVRVEDVFKLVRLQVRMKSRGDQVPWENTSLLEDFYFAGTPSRSGSDESEFAKESAEWQKAVREDNPEGWAKLLANFPSGYLAPLAEQHLDVLQPANVLPEFSPLTTVSGKTTVPNLASGDFEGAQSAQRSAQSIDSIGAGCRTRTRHLMITNQLLYLMS